MKSLAFAKKLEARLDDQRVSDPTWYERAACKGADWSNFEIGVDEVPEVLHKAMTFCVVCPVRRDCVIDAVRKNDKGVIRGGIRFNEKMHRERCRQCRLPVAARRKRCTFCAMERECIDCGIKFAARHHWLKVDRCNTCRTKYTHAQHQLPVRRVRKPS